MMEAARRPTPAGFLIPRTVWAWLGVIVAASGLVAWYAAWQIVGWGGWSRHKLAFFVLSLLLPFSMAVGTNIWLAASARHRSIRSAGPWLWSQRGMRRTARQAEFTMEVDAGGAIRRIEGALHALGARITWRDASGRLIALTPLTWSSWGDDLFVEIVPEGGRCQVRVTSQSILGTTVFDFGRNQANVDRLRAAILTATPA